ncbi:Gfo/Idh/MocA family protein [Halobacillus seohaensis]|uniref:Gfo/Idh/MocA family protein n=1 Tax=Halobacillus seohaensis TaxID=447421 RepID=A0ABW2EI39_9BACI
MKWGIMSAANIAKKALIPALQRTEGAEVYAIASQSGKEKEVSEEFNIPYTYDNYEALLEDPKVEAVYIPLPNHLHKEWTIKAAEAGKHVLCEKPASLTQADVREMMRACEANGVYFQEAFMYQFHPQHQKVKSLIEQGEIGEVTLLRSSFSFNFDRSQYNIRLDPSKGGGSLWDIGCYGVHSALHILDREVKSLTTTAKMDEQFGVDTTAVATLLLEDDIIVQVDCSFDAHFRNEYQVIGTKGMLRVHDAYRPDKNDHQGKITLENNYGERSFEEYGDQYSLQVEAFMKAINEKESLDKYHKETFRYLDVMEKIQHSLKYK